jgi:hypothetical protein
MSLKTKSKCLHCNDEYCCDPRNYGRQKYCPKPDYSAPVATADFASRRTNARRCSMPMTPAG